MLRSSSASAPIWLLGIVILVIACSPEPGSDHGSAAVEKSDPAKSDPGSRDSGKQEPAVPAAATAGGPAAPAPVGAAEPASPPIEGPTDPYAYRDQGLFPSAAMVTYQLLKAEGDAGASYVNIRRTLRGDAKGISFGHLREYLRQIGAAATARREALPAAVSSGRPTILILRAKQTAHDPALGRYVLCLGREPAGVVIVDPLEGRKVVAEADLTPRYLGANLRLDGARVVPAREAPDLYCEEFVHSFGEIASGSEVRHSFRITNRGDRPLNILGVHTTCGCAAAMVGRKGELSADLIAKAKPEKENDPKKLVKQENAGGVIKPGESAWISAYVNTLHKYGYLRFVIRVRTNDPEEPDFEVTLLGNVVKVYQYEPTTAWFQEVRSQEGAHTHVWVRHHRGKPVEITHIKSSKRFVEAALDPDPPRAAGPAQPGVPGGGVAAKAHPAAGGWAAIRIAVRPGAPVGGLSSTVKAKVDGTPIEVHVAANVIGNLVLEPSYFSFGHIRKGEPGTQALTIKSSLGDAFRIESVEADKPFFKAAVQPAGAGAYRITLTLEKGWDAHDLQGQLVIRSNDPLEKRREVQIYGFIRRN